MDVSLTQLKVFLAVARTCNFTRAAEELHLSQPAVSAHIHNLERTTRIKLFDQIGKRIFVTEAGQEILRYAEDMVGLSQGLDGMLDDLRENPFGKLRLAAHSILAIYWLPSILSAFRRKCGNVRLLVASREVDEVMHGVLHNSFDVGLLSDVEPPDQQHPDLEVSEFLSSDAVLITGRRHPWAHRSQIAIEELPGQPFVLFPQDTPSRRVLDEEMDRRGIALNVIMETNTTELIKRVVESGLGISVLPRYCVSRATGNTSRLPVLRIVGLELRYRTYVILHRRKHQTATTRAFHEFLGSYARQTSEEGLFYTPASIQ